MAIVLVLAFVLVPLVLTAALTPVALALFPRFRSRESKPQSSQVAFATRTSSRLPLVGGPILALAIAIGVLFHPDAPLWPLAAIAGFFAFGLIDDLAKTLRGRGIGEGLYFAVIVLLSIAAALLILGRDTHHLGTLTPFALATHVGTDAVVTLGVWYVVLILGTTLAAGFSDGMDGLTAGTATILMTGLWLAAGPVTGVWAGLTAAGAGGALVWNLPSRWAPSARDRPRRARAYIGDSGALMLGATMAVAAIVAGYDLLWPLIAAPLLLEGFSSLVQFKILVPLIRRVVDPRDPDGDPLPHQCFSLPLLAVPLHYHWELLGTRPTIDRLPVLGHVASGNRGRSRRRPRIRRHRPGPRAQRRRRSGLLARRHVAASRLPSRRGRLGLRHARPPAPPRPGSPLSGALRRSGTTDLAEVALRTERASRPINAYVLSQWIAEVRRP